MNIQDALAAALHSVTKDFVREKRRSAARKSDELSPSQIHRLVNQEKKDRVKAAAFEVMEQAYNMASSNGTLPANARQIMYAARPLVLARIGKCWDDSDYFTQTLLPGYVAENPSQTKEWDIVFDARGHFVEPHVRTRLGIGTLNVRQYVNSWTSGGSDALQVDIDDLYPTRGPANRYRFALFIEKEGFDPLLEQAQIAERFDVAIFSSKGTSTTATRRLVDKLSQRGVTILVLHDFDIYGLGIAYTLANDAPRYKFEAGPDVISLGLRLDDVKEMKLESEVWEAPRLRTDPWERLARYGATFEEYDFLVEDKDEGEVECGYRGQRVELNAMTSARFVAWLESKLTKHGVEKVVPDGDVLAKAYHRARDLQRLKENLEAINKTADNSPVPKNLKRRIREMLAGDPRLSWDRALLRIVEQAQGRP